MDAWLLFLYRVPHEPSTRRVYVWRKLKRLGAVMLQDAAWALPMVSNNLEQLQELAGEVADLGGDSLLWVAHLAVCEQDKALVKALQEGKIAGAGLDVFENEPAVEPELLTMENVVLLPHIASASLKTRTLMATMASDNIVAHFHGQRPPNIVNPEVL